MEASKPFDQAVNAREADPRLKRAKPRSGRPRSLAAQAACGILVAVAGLLALPLQAEAQTSLVSNTGQTADVTRGDNRDRAQAFTTGASSGGYTLSSVEIISGDLDGNDAAVSVCTVDVNGFPTSTCTAFTPPSSFAAGTLEFTGSMRLAASTTYTLLIATPGGETLDLDTTISDGEDTGGATGWSIDDAYDAKNASGVWGTTASGKAFRIAVKGTVGGRTALSIADASASENAGHLLFDVTLSRSSPNTVKVDFETISGGTATEGVDYHARRTYTHVILAGDKTAQMGFALIEDTVIEGNETVQVRLSNARVVDAYGDKIKDLDITTAEATGTITAPATTTTNVPNLNIRIQDATGDEDDGYLVFRVRLSRKYTDYVCYDFETISGGTATEGTDYSKRPKVGQWMQTGKRVDKPFVRIIDDSVNDNGETVKVKISNARLCDNASQTVSITRAEATGTIRNTDPLPQALMARFGRTAAVHVVEHVEERLAAPREVGVEAQVAGRQLQPGMEREMALDFLSQLGSSAGMHAPGAGSGGARSSPPMGAAAGSIGPAGGLSGPAGGGMGLATNPMNGTTAPDGGLFDQGLRSMGLGGENLLTNSSFALTRETRQGGTLSFWSRGARSSFAGREEELSLGGDVRTTMFGADYAKGPVVTGLSLSNSRGAGRVRRRHQRTRSLSRNRPLPLAGVQTVGPGVGVGRDRLREGRTDVDARRGRRTHERAVDGDGGSRDAGRVGRQRLERLRAGVQGRCPVGRHIDRWRRGTQREFGGDRGGGNPVPDGAGGRAGLRARRPAVAAAERRGRAAARRRGRRDRRRSRCRRRAGDVGRVDGAGHRPAGADAGNAPGRRIQGAGHGVVCELQPDAGDTAGLYGTGGAVMGRRRKERRPMQCGAGRRWQGWRTTAPSTAPDSTPRLDTGYQWVTASWGHLCFHMNSARETRESWPSKTKKPRSARPLKHRNPGRFSANHGN